MVRKSKITLLILIPVIAVGAIVLYNYFSSRSPEAPDPERAAAAQEKENKGKGRGNRVIPVTVHIADYMQLEEGIRAVGTLLPNEEVDISSEIAGKVEKITFQEGTPVKKGALLVKVNDEDLQSQLKRAVFQRDLLKEKLGRNRILLEKDAISREAFDQIETDYNMVEADIQLLQVKIDKTEIRAPFDGVIGFRYISLGSYVQPNTLVARLVDYSKLKVEFSIPEKYHHESRVGSPISFTTEGNKTINRATIYAIDPKVDEKTRTVSMRALFDNSSMRLLPGMFASVTTGQKTGTTLQIPTEAIVPEADHKKVWVVRNNHAISVPVETGVRGETMVEITKGLQKGDSVIVTGLLQIRENSPLQITN